MPSAALELGYLALLWASGWMKAGGGRMSYARNSVPSDELTY